MSYNSYMELKSTLKNTSNYWVGIDIINSYVLWGQINESEQIKIREWWRRYGKKRGGENLG